MSRETPTPETARDDGSRHAALWHASKVVSIPAQAACRCQALARKLAVRRPLLTGGCKRIARNHFLDNAVFPPHSAPSSTKNHMRHSAPPCGGENRPHGPSGARKTALAARRGRHFFLIKVNQIMCMTPLTMAIAAGARPGTAGAPASFAIARRGGNRDRFRQPVDT